MSENLKPITILLHPETIKKIEDEAKETGIPKGINLRNVIAKHYASKPSK